MVQTSLGSPALPIPPSIPPASPVSCQDLDPALQALFHRAPQLVLTLGHFSKSLLRAPNPQLRPAPWSPAVAKAIKVSQQPGEQREGGKGPSGGHWRYPHVPGHPLLMEAYLRVLPISRDKSRLSWVMYQKEELCLWLAGCLKLMRKRKIEVKVLRGPCEVQGI